MLIITDVYGALLPEVLITPSLLNFADCFCFEQTSLLSSGDQCIAFNVYCCAMFITVVSKLYFR